MKDLRGKRALVTGASSGIGAALARALAARGADLVIAARRQAELDALAAELRSAHGVKVEVVAIDLAAAGAGEALFARTEGAGAPLDIVINNAGFGEHQWFVDQRWERVAQQLQLNIVVLTELTHRFAGAMAARGRGHLMNVASIGAYTPTPTYATYSASKAYVRDFTEAIAFELAPRGVRVCSLCPGLVNTEFHQVSGQELPPALRKLASMSADRCAAIALDALLGWRRNVVSGWLNKVNMWLLRFVPRRAMVWIAYKSMGAPKKLPAASAAAGAGEQTAGKRP
jgi:short-subunit dehydrogenase